MKKAAAFLTLIALLAMVGGTVYLHQREASPNLGDLQPALENIKSLIPETMQVPLVAGLGVFLLITLLLTLMVLFERRSLPQAEKSEQPTVVAPADTSLEEIKQLTSKVAAAEEAQKALKQQISNLDADNANLKNQLEKFSSSSADKSELEQAIAHAKALEADLKAGALQHEKFAADLESAIQNADTAAREKKQLQNEIEALVSRVEKAENDCKNARKEGEKASSHLKTAQSDLEKKNDELLELRRQLEASNQELKSAQANLKGGKEAIPPAAYQILYLFQKEGRLIDLLSEDISELDDETLGGAIRPIHEGCRKLLEDRLILERVLNEEEGSTVTLDEIDPESIKLSGRVPATGPYKGELIHRGWRLKECNLPELVDGWKGNVIAPAEIEIS
ncbi:MAG: DUF2760 domain-containing protein [Candidatus Riflebacteria bacterium]|nr:DUF2760 domain-containing protein [Candidatus Riflebacteria bacterium]